MEPDQAQAIAQRIAGGHAYEKHVMKGDDFAEIKSREVSPT